MKPLPRAGLLLPDNEVAGHKPESSVEGDRALNKLLSLLGFAIITLSLSTTLGSCEHTPVQVVPRWGLFECTVTNPHSYDNPFADVDLEATFVAPSGRHVKVFGFYDGADTWRVRFMPDEVGRWSYKARFTDGSLTTAGTLRCVKAHLHGPLQVCKQNSLWFEHSDGTPFYLCAFHLWRVDALSPTILAKTLDLLAAQGFNAVVGPHLEPPDRLPWERGTDGKVDFSRFNLAVWRNLDSVLGAMAERGMVLIPFSIFGGTNSMPKIPTWQQQDLFLRYWVARWGGFWNATFQPTSEWEEAFSEAGIRRIGSRLYELDGGRHLVSVHSVKASSPAVQREEWYSYHTVQDKLTDWNPTKYTWFVQLYRAVPKPILAHECLWEGNRYQEDAGMDVENLRKAAWVIVLCGGQINYADEVQPQRGVRQRGKGDDFSDLGAQISPRGLFYQQLKVLSRFMQRVSFWRMTPQPELSSTGCCLAERGKQYIVYAPDGGAFTVDLSDAKGPLSGEWLNPVTGGSVPCAPVVGGKKVEFVTPFDNDGVLFVRRVDRER